MAAETEPEADDAEAGEVIDAAFVVLTEPVDVIVTVAVPVVVVPDRAAK